MRVAVVNAISTRGRLSEPHSAQVRMIRISKIECLQYTFANRCLATFTANDQLCHKNGSIPNYIEPLTIENEHQSISEQAIIAYLEIVVRDIQIADYNRSILDQSGKIENAVVCVYAVNSLRACRGSSDLGRTAMQCCVSVCSTYMQPPSQATIGGRNIGSLGGIGVRIAETPLPW